MLTLLWLYIIGGAILSALSIPLIADKIPPNGIYGFRVKATLENPKLWYKVNRFAGMRLLVVGIVTILAALGLYYIPGISVDAYAMICLAIFAWVFILAVVQSVIYLKSEQK
jgi:uncharacterized membrane protein